MDDEMVVRAAIRDELSGPLEGIRRELAATGREAEQAGTKASRSSRGWDTLGSKIGSAARTAVRYGSYALLSVGTAATYGAAKAVTFGIKTAAAMQTAKIGFTTMLGSAKAANAFLAKLAAFAAKTPFEFPELQKAASSLISAGINADKVIPIMTTLGDVTSGMGTGAEGVQRATIALQQMNAAGRITGEDLNQLRDAGIPVYNLLASATGKSKAEVVKLAQAGKLGAKELGQMMKALETGKGLERFSGLMDKQSESLTGVFSTFKDTLGMGLAKALQPAIPGLTKLTLKASDLVGKGMVPLQHGIGEVVDEVNELADSGKLQKWFAQGKRDVVQFWQAVKPLVGDLFTLGKDSLPSVGVALGVVVGLLETGAKVLHPLVAGFDSLPGSAKKALILAAAIYYLSTKMGDLQTRGQGAIGRMKGVGLAGFAMKGGLLAAGVGLVTLGSALQKSHGDMATLATVAGSIAVGFATGGPWGAAIGAGTAVLGLFGQKSQAAADAQRHLDSAGQAVADTLDRQTGAMTAVTRATAVKQLADTGALKAAAAMGINLKDVTNAALGNQGALNRVNAGMKAYGESLHGFDASREGVANLKLLNGAIGSTSKKLDEERSKIYLTNSALGKLGNNHPHVDITIDDNGAKDRIISIQRMINGITGKTVTLRVNGGPTASTGDTRMSHAHGRGNLGSTLRAHGAAQAATGSKLRITNTLIGGGGRGRGSGDHQAGRALDVQGAGAAKYGRYMRQAGGYAAFHGTGPNRHLHVVPPAMGDTRSSKAATVRSRAAVTTGGGGNLPPVIIGAGAIVVNNPESTVDLEQGISDGIDAWMRNREERR